MIRIALAALLFATAAQAEPIAGRATVIDGDTIAVEGTEERIRLYGIDAPESGQTCEDRDGRPYLCGSKSADALAAMIGRNGRVVCKEEDRDRYGRIVAECWLGRTNLNAEIVRAGWAVEYERYSDGRYGTAQREAKQAGRGMWAGAFVQPAEWRRGERMATEEPTPTGPAGCAIKGNVSKSGRIYHLPGSRAYAKTVITEADGERWFCSAEEAEAAGWRGVGG